MRAHHGLELAPHVAHVILQVQELLCRRIALCAYGIVHVLLLCQPLLCLRHPPLQRFCGTRQACAASSASRANLCIPCSQGVEGGGMVGLEGGHLGTQPLTLPLQSLQCLLTMYM